MNPMVCYIYEYKGKQRVRNCGFLKIRPASDSYTIQMHLRSPLIRTGDTWQLFLFYKEESVCVLLPLLALPGEQRAMNQQISLPRESIPNQKSLEELDGLMLRSNADSVFAAPWLNVPLDADNYRIWDESPAPEETASTLSEPDSPGKDDSALTKPDSPGMDDSALMKPDSPGMDDSALTKPDSPGMDDSALTKPDSPGNFSGATDSGNSDSIATEGKEKLAEQSIEPMACEGCPCQEEESSPACTCHKISRSEISSLPRKCWYLANNSFLLHGYHNYHHLALVEEAGRIFLGVPGICDRREAQAAQLYGFPHFSDKYLDYLDLEENEKNHCQRFGHWFREI